MLGVLKAPGKTFENLLQLKRFGLYFEGILSRKWLLSYRNNDRNNGSCMPAICPYVIPMTMNAFILKKSIIENCFIEPYV